MSTSLKPRDLQDRKLALMRKLDRGVISRFGKLDALESAISNYELAYRMQSAAPEAVGCQAAPPYEGRAFRGGTFIKPVTRLVGPLSRGAP